MGPKSSEGTSLETKLEQINFFCESKGFSVQKIVLDIKEELCELPQKALETIDLLWRSRNNLENGNTAYIIVQGIQILGTGLALVGMVFPVVGICSKVVQLVVYFLKIIFKISEPNIKLMLDPKAKTNDIFSFAGLAERLKSLNSFLNAADATETADESAINGIISNVDIHIGVDEIGNLKNRIGEMMHEGGVHVMTCLHYLTIFVRICTLRHSILFRYINFLTGKEYYHSIVHTLQGFIENERVDHQNFLSFFPMPTLDNAAVVAAFDPSKHTELAAFLTEMRLPLQDLRNALHDRVFLIQPVVNSSVLLGRPNAFISDSVKFMTLSLASDNIHIKFKFTAIEHSFNLFYIQSPFSGKYLYMKENLYCKHGALTNPPLNAQWDVVQIQKPDNEDDTISHFLLSTKQWPNRFICLVERDAKGLDDESSPNINCLFKLIPLGGSPIPVQKPVQANPEKAQENPLKTTVRQSVEQRRVIALWTITDFLKERQIKIENDITEIENYVLDESNEEYYFLNSSLESIATVIEVLNGNEFNENMMDGMQRVLLICFELFKDDFPFGSILRQLLRMCGAIISCIWQTHGIADFICRHLKQEDEHRSEIQNDIRALQRFAFFLHEIERCENILEKHISHMINESKICDELGCLANLKETSLTRNHPHLMVTSLKVGVIQLAVTWQKYAVAKYPGHSDLEAKQLRQIIQLQMQNENHFMNKCREKALSTSSLRTVVNMPLFTSGWDMDVTVVDDRQVRRKKITGMLLVVIPQLKKILQIHYER